MEGLLTAKSSWLILQKSSSIDFLLGSKYSSWQDCQKEIQKEMKDWAFEPFLLAKETSSWFLLIG